MMRFFEITGPDTWRVTIDRSWMDEMVASNVLCSLCHRMLAGWFPKPFDVRFARPIQSFNILEPYVTGIALIERRLLDGLLSLAPSCNWAVGRALNQAGEEIASHATLYTSPVIRVRRGPPFEIRVCPECGTVRTRERSKHEQPYLVSYDIADRPIVMDKIGAVFVRSDISGEIDPDTIRPFYLKEIPVRDRPVDGLGYHDDPAWLEGRDATEPWRESHLDWQDHRWSAG